MSTPVKCLVTGGAGFIGSHLCDILIAKGYEVFCVDNLITGSKKNIAHLKDNPIFHFILHDITKPFRSIISSQFSILNYIYHLASPASPIQYRKYSVETLLTNSIGTYNTLKLAKKFDSNYLLASTSEVYGDPLEHPQKEPYYGNVNPVGMRACYDESKRFAEALTMEYVRKFHLKARIIRIFNTYGPRMRKDDGRVISNFITQALKGENLTIYGDGAQTRSFCFVSDMVDGLVKAMEDANINGEVMNLGNPDEKTIREVGELILKLTKSLSKLTRVANRIENDPERRRPDINKANKLLDWRPKVNFQEGLKETMKYFRPHPEIT